MSSISVQNEKEYFMKVGECELLIIPQVDDSGVKQVNLSMRDMRESPRPIPGSARMVITNLQDLEDLALSLLKCKFQLEMHDPGNLYGSPFVTKEATDLEKESFASQAEALRDGKNDPTSEQVSEVNESVDKMKAQAELIAQMSVPNAPAQEEVWWFPHPHECRLVMLDSDVSMAESLEANDNDSVIHFQSEPSQGLPFPTAQLILGVEARGFVSLPSGWKTTWDKGIKVFSLK